MTVRAPQKTNPLKYNVMCLRETETEEKVQGQHGRRHLLFTMFKMPEGLMPGEQTALEEAGAGRVKLMVKGIPFNALVVADMDGFSGIFLNSEGNQVMRRPCWFSQSKIGV